MAGRTDGSMALQDEGPDITMTSGGLSEDGVSQPQSLGYRNIMQSVNDSMRSDFTGQAVTPEGESPEARRSKIKMSLRDAEGAAASQGSTSALDAQSGENNVSSGHINNVGQGGSVRGAGNPQNKDADSKDGKVKGGGFFKKKGPLVSIILSLVFGGGGMYMSQAALPFTMLDKLSGLFDTTNVSTEMRSSSFTRKMMRNSGRTTADPAAITKKNIFGKEKFKPSGKMKRKLAKNGITFEGSGTMLYKNKSGVTEKLSVDDFKLKLETDTDFRSSYTSGTKNWRTSVAEFKDKMFGKLLKKFGLSKNKFAGYDADEDADGSKARQQMAQDADDATDMKVKARQDGDMNDDEVTTKPSETYTDKEGNEHTTTAEKKKTATVGEGTESTEGMKSKDIGAVSAKLAKVSAVANAVTSVGCGITKALSALSVILAGMQLLQVMSVAQSLFEGIDKARTEDADSSPINAIGKSLTLQTSETRQQIKTDANGHGVSSSYSVSTGTAEEDGEEADYDKIDVSVSDAEYEQYETPKRSAVQSAGLSSLYTGDNISADDESVAGFNPTRAANKAIEDVSDTLTDSISKVIGPAGATILKVMKKFISIDDITSISRKSFVACLEIEAALALLDTIIDGAAIVEAVMGLFTFGTTTAAAIAQIAAKEALKIGLKALISLAISALVAWVTPVLINIFARKLATEFMGEDLGNAIYSGGSALMSSNHRAGGGLVADKEGYLASLIYSERVLQDTAKNERLARSPFDYTSAYTFAGQLASSIIPITLQSDSILDSVGNFGSVVRNSINTILPGAKAAGAADKVNYAQKYTEENCEELANIGGIADAFCNPFVTTDFTTISSDDSLDVEDDDNSAYRIVERVHEIDKDNFKEDDIDSVDNPQIDLDSDLGRYVIYCGQRSSPFGQPDQNIVGEIANVLSTGSQVGDAVVDALPLSGIKNIVSNQRVLNKYGWVDGSNCVMNHDKDSGYPGADRVSYDDIQVYNRYAEDQRLAAAMGVVEESAVDVALEEYYSLHPLDESYEGQLARVTGMTKEDIIATIDALEFYVWLADYNPTDYYPTPAIHKEAPDYRIEDDRMIQDDGILAVIRAGFETVYRQRNFATA